MSITHTLWACSLCLGLLSTPGHAFEANQRQGLGPEQQLKVGQALARSYLLPTGQAATRPTTTGTSSGTNIGTVTTPSRFGRVETNVVARDIITVNRPAR